MDIATIATVVGVIGGLFAIYFGLTRNNRMRTEDAERDGSLRSDIGYIKSGIDDMKRKQEQSEERYLKLDGRVTRVEESAKQAHKRIDCWEGKK